ncbi:YheC/YheD family protein [Gorillibacterium massiliense]|uniref:YheC/YheD family protein n=1 Tax=Gorillibacterium massiliense TaxID=1280390 RepID=UPI0004B3C083|nr:YheC/YheD family protein [Gorillibacterium massiliense]
MSNIKKNHIRSKLAVSFLLSETPSTARYIPDTQLLYRESLIKMTEAHQDVYIKPDRGVQGIGIKRVQRADDGTYLLRTNSYSVNCPDLNTLWSVLHRLTGDSRHVIQRTITSKTYDGDPFDMRVHVFRVNGTWKLGPMFARLDSNEKITTNVARGGKILLMETLFQKHLLYDEETQQKMLESFKQCAEAIGQTLNGMYPPYKEYGIDVGIDSGNQLWVYEVNLNPLQPAKIIEGSNSVYSQYQEIKAMSS